MKITKAQFDALTGEQQKLWKKLGDDEYELAGDGDIAAEMRRARDREIANAANLQKELDKAKLKLAEIEGDSARKSGDIDLIEAGWKKKVKDAEDAGKTAVSTLKEQIKSLLLDNTLNAIAGEIFTKPGRDVRLLKDRVTVDFDGEKPAIRVLDKDGKASALTLDDLKKEVVDNPDYADILVGSKASGSGGTGGNKGGGAAKQPSEYTEAERVALYNSNRAEYFQKFPQSNQG